MPDETQSVDQGFDARTKAARARIEPELRRWLAEWDTLHSKIDGGGAPSMMRAISEVLGRCCAEMLPDGFPPKDALGLITASACVGMMEVLHAPGSGQVAHA